MELPRDAGAVLNTAMSNPSMGPCVALNLGWRTIPVISNLMLYSSSLTWRGTPPVCYSPHKMSTSRGAMSPTVGLRLQTTASSVQLEGRSM